MVDEANHMVNNLGDIGYHSQTIDNYGYDAIGQLVSEDDEDIGSIEWTLTNKVKQITKTNGITIRFEYDGLGNRIAKHVTEGGDVTSTYYVLDAQGNVMNVYTGNTRAVDGGGTTYYLYLSERNLYGSSRLGQEQVNMALTQAAPFVYSGLLDNAYGDKRYELSNHLGNVLQVVRDAKLPVITQQNTASITFVNATGVSVSGNNLTKMAATGWGNAGAVSQQTVLADQYLEWELCSDISASLDLNTLGDALSYIPTAPTQVLGKIY